MSEIFLVALWRPEAARTLLDAARRAARDVGQVRLDVLAVRRAPSSVIIPSDEVMAGEQFVMLRDREAARAAALRKIFEAWMLEQPPGLACRWTEAEGVLAEEIAQRAIAADFIVVERPPVSGDEPANQLARAALVESHRPVLIVPAGAKAEFGRHIAIAWKDDGRAMNALLPAIRYFGRDADVAVLIAQRGNEEVTLPAPIADRGMNAALYALKPGAGPTGQLILEKAASIGADLLIMGAFAKSTFRELLQAGTTRYVLAHAQIPVLMRH